MRTNDDMLLHAIRQAPEYLRSLASTIASRANADLGMALTTLMSGMASGVHGLKAVERPDGGLESLGLFEIVLSDTTSGKTRTHKLVHAPHRAQDVLRYKAYERGRKAGAAVRLREVIQPLTNNRALLEGLEGIGHATAISAHDGQSVLNSHFFRQQLDIANVLWDGNDKVTLPGSNGARLMVFDASLNLLFMVQHDTFRKHLKKGSS